MNTTKVKRKKPDTPLESALVRIREAHDEAKSQCKLALTSLESRDAYRASSYVYNLCEYAWNIVRWLQNVNGMKDKDKVLLEATRIAIKVEEYKNLAADGAIRFWR